MCVCVCECDFMEIYRIHCNANSKIALYTNMNAYNYLYKSFMLMAVYSGWRSFIHILKVISVTESKMHIDSKDFKRTKDAKPFLRMRFRWITIVSAKWRKKAENTTERRRKQCHIQFRIWLFCDYLREVYTMFSNSTRFQSGSVLCCIKRKVMPATKLPSTSHIIFHPVNDFTATFSKCYVQIQRPIKYFDGRKSVKMSLYHLCVVCHT